MSTNFQKKSSQIFLTLFIGIIVISFVMSGPFFGTGTPDTIGAVGDQEIKLREFNGEIQRQSQFYSQIFKGGEPLTSSELSQYKIYDNAVKNLVFQKLRLILAKDAGISVSAEEIKKDIKDAKFFQTGGQFDISRYKGLLAANQLTPEDFEKETLNKLRDGKLQAMFSNVTFSEDLVSTLNTLYQDKRMTDIISITADDLKKSIQVSTKEINDYLAIEVNLKRVEAAFNQQKEALSQKEQVKARHILISADEDDKEALAKITKIKSEVNVKNFSTLAKKYTDEPSGKESGGDLNWVSHGQMVPEFEKALFSLKAGQISAPVKTEFGYHIILAEAKKEQKVATLADHKNEIAKDMIQKEKDVKDLFNTAKSEIVSALEAKKDISSLKKKYNITVQEKVTVNKLEGFGTNYSFENGFEANVFSKPEGVFVSDQGIKFTIVNAKPFTDNATKFDLEPIKNMISTQTMKALLDKLGESYTFKQNKFARLPN